MATFLERKMETTMLEKKKKMMRPSSRLEDRDPGLAAALALQDRAARARADQRRQEMEVTKIKFTYLGKREKTRE